VLLVVGTRPEAIKVAPVALAAAAGGGLRTTVVATGQHRELVDHALAAFGVGIDHRLELPERSGGSQAELFTALLPELDRVLGEVRPHAVLVQGDTASALAGGLVATWHQVPLVHLEAGLRSFDRANPFPEESYRCLIGAVADLHLAPTPRAVDNLLAEGVSARRIVCTGNTVVDAARFVVGRAGVPDGPADATSDGPRSVVVTVHRRENWGEPLLAICRALRAVVARVPDVEIVLPVHPNPLVRGPVREALADVARIRIVDPLDHPTLLRHLARATLVLTDSGGIQEEAPTFGVPVLVLRETTERPEAIEAGCAELVGTDPEVIEDRAVGLLLDEAARRVMATVANPYGDGRSGERSVAAIRWLLGRGPVPEPWAPADLAPGVAETARS
jgi:UDP-N-acetylglucosamine 2-epimerase (non-hydrolysing)